MISVTTPTIRARNPANALAISASHLHASPPNKERRANIIDATGARTRMINLESSCEAGV